MGDIQKELETLVEQMPAFPVSVQRVLSLSADINCAPKDLVRVINHDPVLTMRILKVANSSYFGLNQRISSINHAVVYIGINTVKHLAIAIATIGMLPRGNREGFDADAFLLHALTTASVSRLLAAELGIFGMATTDFFIAGLLHDIGQVVLNIFDSSKCQQVLHMVKTQGTPITEAEQHLFGMDHCEVGGFLGDRWNFPETITETIRFHHDPMASDKPSDILDCICLANLLAYELGSASHPSLSQVRVEPPFAVVDRWGDSVADVLDHLQGVEEELNQARIYLDL